MRRSRLTLPVLTLALGTFAAAAADEPPKRPWSDQAEVGIVATTGNSQGTNVSLSNKFKYAWSNAELSVDAAALRAESTTRTLSNSDGTARATDTSRVTAENYFLAAKYRMTISERLYWFAATSWYRNLFAGLNSRTNLGGGVGYTFLKGPRHILKAEGGAEYTREVPLEGFDTHNFAGVHGFLGYEFKLSEKAKLTEDLNVFENVQETGDWRGSSVTAVTASLTTRLALKVSYSVLYANRPQESLVPPDPAAPIGTPDAVFRFDKTDTMLTAALVINF
jgi:putative salt-induced outer membrane protein